MKIRDREIILERNEYLILPEDIKGRKYNIIDSETGKQITHAVGLILEGDRK